MKNLIIVFTLSFLNLIGFGFLSAQTLPVPAPVFGENGHLNFPMSPFAPNGIAVAYAVQNDGKIILAGRSYEIASPNPAYYILMVRIDPICGKLDSTFGSNGILKHKFLKDSECNSIALQPDGKILGCGRIIDFSFFPFPATFRFNPDGSVDSTYNGNGFRTELILNQQGEAHEIMLANEGEIIVAAKGGSALNHCLGVFKYLNNGQLDSSYGENGKQTIPFLYAPDGNSMTAVMNADSSVTVLTLVGSGPFGARYISAGRITKNGIRDSTFNLNGYREYPEISMTNAILGSKDMDASLLSDGRIVLRYGNLTNDNVYSAHLVVFTPEGAVDSSFGENGIFTFFSPRPMGGGIFVDENDRILLFTNYENTAIATILRILPNGQLDSNFGNNGVLLAPFGNQPDNRIFNDGFILPNGDIFAFGELNGNGFTASRFTFNPDMDGIPQITQEGNTLTTIGLGAFQWYLNDEPIAGATQNNYEPTADGLYTVSMGFEYCTFTSEPFEIISTSIQFTNFSNIKIRNNPTSDFIFIDNAPSNMIWEIFNIEGKRLLSGNQLTDAKIDMREFETGIYILRCGNMLQTATFKIIKQ